MQEPHDQAVAKPSWEPGAVRDPMFSTCISVPLGVAHRRSLLMKIGGFNEAWCEEDSDVWRRFARCGAEFTFVRNKSGRYHVHGKNASRSRPITKKRWMVDGGW